MLRATIQIIVWLATVSLPAFAETPPAVRERMAREWEAYWAEPDKPLDLAVRADRARAVRAAIGSAGGRLVLDTPDARFTLTIPEDHLFYPAEISLTPVVGITGLGEVPRTLAVEIGPSGLALAAPVWLHVAPKHAGALDRGFFAFGFGAGGRDAHFAWRIREGDGVAVSVSHFSGFGLGAGALTNMALAQSKPRAASPNATQTQKKAAEISRDDQAVGRAINKALAGEEQTADVDLVETVKSFFGGGASPGGGTGRGAIQTPGTDCLNIEKEIENINVQTGRDEKNTRAIPRDAIAEVQWANWRRCAERPARICYDTGNPWPLVRYLKSIRLLKPRPDEAAQFAALVAWIEGELKKCAAYELRVKTNSRAVSSNVQISSATTATLKVALALASDEKGKDRFLAEDRGRVVEANASCRGASCQVGNTRVEESASMVLTLGDLPFDSDNRPPSAAGFTPLVEPAFVHLDTKITAPRGPSMTIPFETNYAFWRCHYLAEFVPGTAGRSGSPGLFRLKGWTSGAYPVLFRLARPVADKSCDGTPIGLGVELEFVHKPSGAFAP